MSPQREFDAIVIGSGIGDLAFASIMAKLRKWSILVLGWGAMRAAPFVLGHGTALARRQSKLERKLFHVLLGLPVFHII